MIWKERHDNHLWIFWNGKILYKQWIDSTGKHYHSMVFDSFGNPWSPAELEVKSKKLRCWVDK